MIAKEFIQQGYPLNKVPGLCGLSKSTYCCSPFCGKRGRTSGTSTLSKAGILHGNGCVLGRIQWLLNQEFTDYGYGKAAAWLKRSEGSVTNKKKVCRLMKEACLLNSRVGRNRTGKRIARDLLPNPTQPFECMQTDIKYVYIHGQRRNALPIPALGVLSRGVLGYRLEWSITKHQVIGLLKEVLYHYRMPAQVSLRTDNGSQFEAGLFRECLKQMCIDHEFTHVATPQETCCIESFRSIAESAVCAKYEFGNLKEAKAVFNRFMNFYKQRRLHGRLKYQVPNQFLQSIERPQKLRWLPVDEQLVTEQKYQMQK